MLVKHLPLVWEASLLAAVLPDWPAHQLRLRRALPLQGLLALLVWEEPSLIICHGWLAAVVAARRARLPERLALAQEPG